MTMPEQYRREQILTQGRAAAERVLAMLRPSAAAAVESAEVAGGGAAPAAPGAGRVDPYAVAEKVYETWRQELRAELERRKWR